MTNAGSPPPRQPARPAPPEGVVADMRDALVRRFGGQPMANAETPPLNATVSESTPGLRPQDDTSDPRRLGRFELRERVGAGAMGVVYAAYDPVLERDVAVKFIRAGGASASAQTRAFREAQGLARLSHPNVVQVFEVGQKDDGVFVAMELVRGQTLDDWQRSDSPSWREVLEAYCAAGLGLAAAHRAGLVHRDFKPANVMRDPDGRVRVLDFGLVREAEPTSTEPSQPEITEPLENALAERLTQTRGLLGTPAYMAPEQLLGGVATAASDQFSFCVALYEALNGQRPFAGTTPVALVSAVLEGEIVPPKPGRDTPPWLATVLARGLAPDPGDRYTSMQSLLGALRSDPKRRRLRLMAAAAGALIVAAAAVALLDEEVVAAQCNIEPDLSEVWGETQQAAVQQALARAEAPGSTRAWTLARDTLDRYADQFQRTRDQACSGPSDPAVLRARIACLAGRRDAVHAVVQVLAEAEASTVTNIVRIVGGLPRLQTCTDPSLTSPAPLLDAQTVADISVATRLTHRALALSLVPKLELALEVAAEAHAAALRSDQTATIARALAVRAGVHIRRGELDSGRVDLTEAHHRYVDAGDAEQAAETALSLVWVDVQTGDLEAATQWVRTAEAQLNSGDLQDSAVAARLALRRGQLAQAKRDPAASSIHLRDAAARFAAHDDAVEEGAVLNDLANTLMQQGDVDESVEVAQRAIALLGEALGDQHPQVATAYHNLGNIRQRQQRTSEALTAHKAALSRRLAALGPKHPNVCMSAYAVATDLFDEHRLDESLDALTQAKAAAPDTHPVRAAITDLEAKIAVTRGEYDKALRLSERGIVEMESTVSPDDPGLTILRLGKAGILNGSGRHAEAAALGERCIAVLTARLGSAHPIIGQSSNTVAGYLLDAGHHDRAAAMYRAALDNAQTHGEASGPVATATVGLAEVLASQGKSNEAAALAGRVAATPGIAETDPEALARAQAILTPPVPAP